MVSFRCAVVLACVALLACTSLVAAIEHKATRSATPFPYKYETKWWTAQVDNFNFGQTNETFQLKYLVNEEFYQPGGPIFFYTGNEGPIELFADNTGFMWDIAPEFGAMIVFAEHRYYGDSLPFGNVTSFTNEGFQHLSAEQALADYALFLGSFKGNDTRITDAQVIAFGGSYGGMLASWFRLRYPHVVAGAIAGSAPIWFFDQAGGADFDAGAYNRIASNDFKDVSQACFDNIARSWQALVTIDATIVNAELGLCAPGYSTQDEIEAHVWPWLSNVYATLPMGDYPMPAQFLGNLPAWPVNATCAFFSEPNMSNLQLVRASRQAADLFYNASQWIVPGTGTVGSCHNPDAEIGIASLGAGQQWPYQSCTEMVMPIGQVSGDTPKRRFITYGPPNDLFYPAPWSLSETIASCQSMFGVTPRPYWILAQFGGAKDWASATNIVFSNGNLDPWSGGGVLTTLSETVVAVPVEGGAHHLDLRAATEYDTPGVIAARETEVAWIRRFLANPSPQTGSDCKDEGISKSAVALYAIVSTAVFCALVWLLFAYCAGRAAAAVVRGQPYEQHSSSAALNSDPAYLASRYNALPDERAASPSRSQLHPEVDGSPNVRLTVR